MTPESKEQVRRALADLGWEVGEDREGSGEVLAGHGKHHLMVGFQNEEPVSVTISYVGKGGEILSRAWPGAHRLPTPKNVVRLFARKR